MTALTAITAHIKEHKTNNPFISDFNIFTFEPGDEPNRSHVYTSPTLRNDNHEGTMIACIELGFSHLGKTHCATVYVHIVDTRTDDHRNRARLNYDVFSLKRTEPGHMTNYGYSPRITDAMRKSLFTAVDQIIGIDTPADNWSRFITITKAEVVRMLTERLNETLDRAPGTQSAHHYRSAVDSAINREIWGIARYRNSNVHGVDLTEPDLEKAATRARAHHKRGLLAKAKTL